MSNALTPSNPDGSASLGPAEKLALIAPETVEGYRKMNTISLSLMVLENYFRSTIFDYVNAIGTEDLKQEFVLEAAKMFYLKAYMFDRLKEPAKRQVLDTPEIRKLFMLDLEIDVIPMTPQEVYEFFCGVVEDFDMEHYQRWLNSADLITKVRQSASSGMTRVNDIEQMVPRHYYRVDESLRVDPATYIDHSDLILDAGTQEKARECARVFLNALNLIAAGGNPESFKEGLFMKFGTDDETFETNLNRVEQAAFADIIETSKGSGATIRSTNGTIREITHQESPMSDFRAFRSVETWADLVSENGGSARKLASDTLARIAKRIEKPE